MMIPKNNNLKAVLSIMKVNTIHNVDVTVRMNHNFHKLFLKILS